MPLLEVRNLHVKLRTHRGPAYAVRDVSFTLERGETLGLVGESGCGKSITVMALMGLLPEGAEVTGSIRFDGEELVGKSDAALCAIRGNRIGMIFQEPMTALNPVHSIGRQVAEPLRLHRGLTTDAARKEAIALLDRVGIPEAARRIDAYPHQFSGGQRQRITIAMALACGPQLLIAERGMAQMLISHDLGVIAQNVERMMVMYGGSVVESGETESVFRHRAHPYTLGLFAARPGLRSVKGQRLMTIAGTVPELVDLPAGCPFAGRCAFTIPACHETAPPPVEVGPGHLARCIRLEEVARAALHPALSQREREEQP